MKNLFFIVMIGIITLSSCNSGQNNNKNSAKKEGGVEIGTLRKGNRAEANLQIPIEKAVELIKDNNRLTQDIFNYKYTNAWVEVVETGYDSYEYFLAFDADLTSKGKYMTYSCYSVYSQLEEHNYRLYFHPESAQYSLRGKCCNKCNLIFKDGKLDTECGEGSQEDNCNGNGRCSLSESKEISKEQIKNDMI